MKRINRLFEQIITDENIKHAWLKAIRGKRNKRSTVVFSQNTGKNLSALKQRITSLDPLWGNYSQFIITDPKERLISAASIEERIMHHAIMNILDHVFDRRQIFHSYACRKGKGTHAAVMYAFRKTKSNDYVLKLDIRKYFDSIDHLILKKQIADIIKDSRVLHLLNGIIDSYKTQPGKGIPIGNLTSQYFANLYLSGLDHFILEELRPKGYVRYMDDFAVWAHSKAELTVYLQHISLYITDKLSLVLKKPILMPVKNGLPFLGFLIKPEGIFLLQKSKRRMKKQAADIYQKVTDGIISEDTAAMRVISVNAAVLLARTHSFRVTLWTGAASGSNRIQRGGSWNNNADNCTVSNRNNNNNPYNRNNNNGFRVVRSSLNTPAL